MVFSGIFNVVSDAEVRDVPNGSKVATVRVAENRPPKQGEERGVADFFNLTFWNKGAEIAAEKAHKGSRVSAEGVIQTRSYESKDGSKRTATDFIVRRYLFA